MMIKQDEKLYELDNYIDVTGFSCCCRAFEDIVMLCCFAYHIPGKSAAALFNLNYHKTTYITDNPN